MRFFLGYDIDESLPWHSTLSRTRQLYGEDLFKGIFKQVLVQCIDKGMVAGIRQAMDSAPVKANASMGSLVEKEILDDADVYADELNETEEDQNKSVSSTRKKRLISIMYGKPGNNKENMESRIKKPTFSVIIPTIAPLIRMPEYLQNQVNHGS